MAKRIGRLTKLTHRIAQRQGARYAEDALVIYVRRDGATLPRLGISVGRQFGGAVDRNRLRRKVRAACLQQWRLLPARADLVVIPRAPAATMTVAELEAVLARLLENLGRGNARAEET